MMRPSQGSVQHADIGTVGDSGNCPGRHSPPDRICLVLMLRRYPVEHASTRGEDMADDETAKQAVQDADIQAIIEQGEAGIEDLIAAYEPIERQYFAAVQAYTGTAVSYAIDTNPPS